MSSSLRIGLVCGLLVNSAFVSPGYADPYTNLSDNLTPPTIPLEETAQVQTTEKTPSRSDEWGLWSSPLGPASTGRSFYVSKTGSNDADGSEMNPWQTIQYGVSQLLAGDTLYILEGLYEESAAFSSSGLPDAPITVQGIGNVVIDGSNLSAFADAFDTNGNDYIHFYNLTVNHMRTGVNITPGSEFITIDGFEAYGNNYAVRIKSASNVTVRNAYADNSHYGFRADGNSHDLFFEKIQAYHSIAPSPNPDYTQGDGVILERDIFNVSILDGIFADNGDAGIDSKAHNVKIDRVEVFGNKNNFKTWGETTIQNSLSHHAKRQLRSDGTTVEGNGITVVSGTTKILNTTFVDNEDHDIRIYQNGSLSLENSIVARRNTGGMLFQNNGFFTSDRVLWYRTAEDYSNLTLSLTDFWANPEFVDWGNGDYHLKEISLAVNYGNTGDPLSPYDLDLNPRLIGSRPDLGAYEFQSVPSPKFTGISHGETVSGKIFVKPDRNTFPTLRMVTYYLDGKRVYSTSKSPYTWGGTKGFDTKKLKDGTHILKALFQISKQERQEFSIAFTVDNSSSLQATSEPTLASADPPECQTETSKKKRKKLGCSE